ncbi:hypothetical protein, partial [Paraburkholderia sabiae]|uniref:hypothetical protein n=1 Tax=Paraburkholderia sabiae TaxID=273251 RepID=UPI001F2681B1
NTFFAISRPMVSAGIDVLPEIGEISVAPKGAGVHTISLVAADIFAAGPYGIRSPAPHLAIELEALLWIQV